MAVKIYILMKFLLSINSPKTSENLTMLNKGIIFVFKLKFLLEFVFLHTYGREFLKSKSHKYISLLEIFCENENGSMVFINNNKQLHIEYFGQPWT